MNADYERPDRMWTGPEPIRGAGHAQAVKHYTDMAAMAELLAAKAELVEALKPFAQQTAFSRAAGNPKQSVKLPLEAFETARALVAKHGGQS